MNRHEAAIEAVRAMARNDLAGAREILQSNIDSVMAAASAPHDPPLIVRSQAIHEANGYRREPRLEYLGIALLCALDAFENHTAPLAANVEGLVDWALRVAIEEDCGVEQLGKMAISAREPTDQSYCISCMAVAKHYIDHERFAAANAWLDRMEQSNLDGIFLKTVQHLRALATADRAAKSSSGGDP